MANSIVTLTSKIRPVINFSLWLLGVFAVWMNIVFSFFFFFNDTATTEIYTLSLHDALPILFFVGVRVRFEDDSAAGHSRVADRKSTRLNSSHTVISYAVFCLKKKKNRK